MSDQPQEQAKQEEPKAPVVEIKKAAKRTTSKAAEAKEAAKAKVQKPHLSDTAKKRLEDLTKEIQRIEGLKEERQKVMQAERDRGVPTTEIAGPAGYSVARARQLLGK
jgi:hypothetical protein